MPTIHLWMVGEETEMYRTYGSLQGFRNCDDSFEYGGILLLSADGLKKIWLFARVDEEGDMRVRLTAVRGYPEIGFDKFPYKTRAEFYWADLEDALSGMHPRKAWKDSPEGSYREFVALVRVLDGINERERTEQRKQHQGNRRQGEVKQIRPQPERPKLRIVQ